MTPYHIFTSFCISILKPLTSSIFTSVFSFAFQIELLLLLVCHYQHFFLIFIMIALYSRASSHRSMSKHSILCCVISLYPFRFIVLMIMVMIFIRRFVIYSIAPTTAASIMKQKRFKTNIPMLVISESHKRRKLY